MFVSGHIIPLLLWRINVFLDSECSSFDNISWNPNSIRLTVGLHLKHRCSPNNKLKINHRGRSSEAEKKL